jgi:hypothetical protein
LTSM